MRKHIDTRTLRTNLAHAVVGYDELKAALIAAYAKRLAGLPRAHVLMFGPPGVGKTYATKTFARLVAEVSGSEVGYARIQGRADLMPEEFLAERMAKYDEQGRPGFVYELGTVGRLDASAVLPAILQFDELDKTPGRTQHGLLEAMEEQQLSLPDGRQIPLSFVLVATANTRRFDPASQPIPRSTQDRFGNVVFVDYLPLEGDLEVLQMHERDWDLGLTADPALLTGMVQVVKLSQRELPGFTDFAKMVKVPAGPRGFLDLYANAATQAMCDGRSCITVQDIRDVAVSTLRGRIEVRAESEIAGRPVEVLIRDMLEEVFGKMRVQPQAERPQEPEEEKPEPKDEPEEAKPPGDGSGESSSQSGGESEKEGEQPSESDGSGGQQPQESKDSSEGEEGKGDKPKPSDPKESSDEGSGKQKGSGAGKGSQPSQSYSPPSGSGQGKPQTGPTGGQGHRPAKVLAGLRKKAGEDPASGPFPPAR